MDKEFLHQKVFASQVQKVNWGEGGGKGARGRIGRREGERGLPFISHLLLPLTELSDLHTAFQSYELRTTVTLHSQIRVLRLRLVKSLPQGHTARKHWTKMALPQSLCINPYTIWPLQTHQPYLALLLPEEQNLKLEEPHEISSPFLSLSLSSPCSQGKSLPCRHPTEPGTPMAQGHCAWPRKCVQEMPAELTNQINLSFC